MSYTLIPGHDAVNGNTNSCLYRAFGDQCVRYDPAKPIAEQLDAFPEQGEETVVAHSYGFAAFVAARAAGRLQAATKLIVLDGWYPEDGMWTGEPLLIQLPNIQCIFFFPTVGNRSEYKLEADIVRPAMASAHDITIVRGQGFGHNLVYQSFGADEVKELIKSLGYLTGVGIYTVEFPQTGLKSGE